MLRFNPSTHTSTDGEKMSHAASSTPEPSATVKIPYLTCAECSAVIHANASEQPGAKPASAIDLIADRLLDAELWPEDSELVAEIRAMFMHNWGMDQAQADARMSRLDYSDALSSVMTNTKPDSKDL